MAQATESVRKSWVEIDVAGSPMEAYVAKPAGNGPWPAVIVFMEIFGVNEHIRSVTERVAAEGYVAIAPNYYHRTTRNLELGYNQAGMVEGRKHKDQTTREGILSDVHAVIQHLRQDGNVANQEKFGTIGFCFGGHVAYIAAGLDEVAATASFYGGGIATSSPGGGAATVTHTPEIQGEILCLFGTEDQLIPLEDVVTVENALKAANVRHEVIRYPGVGHGFFRNGSKDHNAVAAEESWRKVQALFDRNLR